MNRKSGQSFIELGVAMAILSVAIWFAYQSTPKKDEDSAKYLEVLRALALQSLQEAKTMGVPSLPLPGQCLMIEYNADATVFTPAAAYADTSNQCSPKKVTEGKYRITLTTIASPTLPDAPTFSHPGMQLPKLSSTFRQLFINGAYLQNGKTGTVALSSLKRY